MDVNLVCKVYNNVGHIVKYCRGDLEIQKADDVEQVKETNNEVENSMVVQTTFHAQGKINIWVIDSGCSSDMIDGRRMSKDEKSEGKNLVDWW